MKVKEPDLEEITRFWGSVEAYKEEQRRTNLAEMDSKQFWGPISQLGQPAFFNPLATPRLKLREWLVFNTYHKKGHPV